MRAERERAALPTIALAGYTNAGKSTLLNALTAAYGRGGGRPGRTRPARARPPLSHTRPDHAHCATSGGGPATSSPTRSASSASSPTSWWTPSAPRWRRRSAPTCCCTCSTPRPLRARWRRCAVRSRRCSRRSAPTRSPRVLVLNKADLLDEQARQAAAPVPPRGGAARAASAARVSTCSPPASSPSCATRSARSTCSSLRQRLQPRRAAPHALAGELARRDTPEGVRVRALVPARLAPRFARFAVV